MKLKPSLLTSLLGVVAILSSFSLFAVDHTGRMGVGFANQMKNGIPSLSFKLQQSKAFAFGGQVGFSNDDLSGGYNAALKIYRNFFEEPNLTFFGSVLGGIIKQKTGGISQNGFQVDLTLGSEFSFTNLESLGLSIEFGASFNKINSFVIETVGNSFIVSAIHFYL